MAEPSKMDSNLVVIGASPSIPSPEISQPSDWRYRMSQKAHRLTPVVVGADERGAGGVALVLALAYWPNFRELYSIWKDDPNYSHGSLVIPIALVILWQRLSSSTHEAVPETRQNVRESRQVVRENPCRTADRVPRIRAWDCSPPSRLPASSPHIGGVGWVCW